MTKPWITRVEQYLDSLAQGVEALHEALDNTRVGTKAINVDLVNSGAQELTAALQGLERLIAERGELLTAQDVPLTGISIRDILSRMSGPEAASLAQRCTAVSRDVEQCRERAVALFVCQFHLSETSSHLLALLRSGVDHGATYENGKSQTRRSNPTTSLFNKAA